MAHTNWGDGIRNCNVFPATAYGERRIGDPHRPESWAAIEKEPDRPCRQATTDDLSINSRLLTEFAESRFQWVMNLDAFHARTSAFAHGIGPSSAQSTFSVAGP